MRSVGSQERSFVLYQPECSCIFNNAPSSIAAHAAGISIGVVIHHLKIISGLFLQKHQPVSTDPEPPVAKLRHQRVVIIPETQVTVIDQDKVIPGALVFCKGEFHFSRLIIVSSVMRSYGLKSPVGSRR